MTDQTQTAGNVGSFTENTSLGFRARSLFLKHEWLRGYTLLSPTLLVMICLMCVPIFMLVAYSFWTQNYLDIDKTFTFANYEAFFQKPIYVALMMKSIRMSLFCTAVTLLLAYPMAYFIAFKVKTNKLVWLILITVPFWTSYLLRVFAWKVILGFNGVINSGLISMGLLDEPLQFLLYNPTAVVLTLAHAWAAFAILSIYVSLEKIDRSLLEAATDLGDTPTERFWRVTWPLSLPGMVAAGLLVFIPTVGDYVTPRLVGGTTGIMIGNIVQSQFGKANNWPMGAALSVISMILITILVVTFITSTTRARAKSA
jgi:spermidine/putrescine transport system permease protein